MDELNDLLRGITEEMKSGMDARTPSSGDQQSAPEEADGPNLQRPAPPGLRPRSDRPGSAQADSCPACGGAGFLLDDCHWAIRLWHANSLPLQIARKTSATAQPLARCTQVGGANPIHI